MLYTLFAKLDQTFHFTRARAHCDIPCGIYDPHLAQVAALTVIRMDDLIADLAKAETTDKVAYHNSMTRYIAVKEEHAELCKREVRVIWGDYFKQEHIEKFPELPTLTHKIFQLGSKARQTADREVAVQLLEAVNRFAEIYWETKGIATKRVKAPYKPPEEVVYPLL
ncbi:MAG: superoxide dismutase, Ni [Anaerolineales bacterium]|jgi:nickel superoxide dismutase